MSSRPLVALGDIFEIARGGSPRPIEKFLTDDPAGVNWIMIADATDSQKYITGTKKRILKTGVKNSRMVHPGDFLLTNSMSFGRPYILKTSGCIHDGWLVLSRKRNDVDQDYFFHLLKSKAVYSEFARRAAGATVKNLNIDIVKEVQVQVPPIEEQRRIAKILDWAEALRAKRCAAITQLDTLVRFIFLEQFGDPIQNSKKWPRVPFSELLASIDSGWSPVCQDRAVVGEEWGVLKLGAVTWCEYNCSENKALPPDVDPDRELEVKVGDLLFVRKNTYDRVAACALVRETQPRLLLSDLIFRLRPRAEVQLDTCYLHQLLIYPTKRREIQKLAGGTAGSMPNISKSRLQTIPIEVPPLDFQRDFSRRVAAVEKLRVLHRAALDTMDAMFASLQHRAFRGEL